MAPVFKWRLVLPGCGCQERRANKADKGPFFFVEGLAASFLEVPTGLKMCRCGVVSAVLYDG